MLAFKIKNRFVLIALSIITATSVSAQKKTIGSETYDEWNKIEKVQQSPSGDWITYEIKPLEGDGNLIIESTVSSKQNKYPRGTVAKLHYQDKFAAFLIKPQHDTVHKLKLDKVKKIKFPKDTLAIYWADKDSLATFPNITSFKIAQEGDWIAYLSSKDLRPKPKKKKKKKKKKGTPEIKTSGKTLFL